MPQAKCKHQQLHQKLANSYANYTNIIADFVVFTSNADLENQFLSSCPNLHFAWGVA
jgi:hypothetical protein